MERIAERRVAALRLRRGGASYREIAELTGVDVATAYADVRAELAALRQQTIEEANELRDLELQRFGGFAGLDRQSDQDGERDRPAWRRGAVASRARRDRRP